MGFCSLEALLCFCLIWCPFLRQMKQNKLQIKDTSHSHREITEIKTMWEAALALFFPQVERERSILSVPAAATGHWVCCSPIPAAGIYLGEAAPWVMAPGKTGNGHAVVWGEQGEAVFSSQLWEFYSQRAFQCSLVPLSLVNGQMWLLNVHPRKAFCGLSASSLRAFSVLELQLVVLVKGGCLSGSQERLLIISHLLLPIQNCYSVSIFFHFTASPSVFDICKFF